MEETGIRVPSQAVEEKWAGVPTPRIQMEAVLPRAEADVMWNRIYALFGARNEDEMNAAFLAVVAYHAMNGCSPSGSYSRSYVTGMGVTVPVDGLIKIVGKTDGQLRQFFRAHNQKTYDALKYSKVLALDELARSRAESKGIPMTKAHLLADWYGDDAPFLTAEEHGIYRATSGKSIADSLVRTNVPGTRADTRDVEVPVDIMYNQPPAITGGNGNNKFSY